MHGLSRVPKWVKSFPDETVKEALLQLAHTSSGMFDKPREMNFVLYGVSDGEELSAIKDKLDAKGWHCSTVQQADEPNKLVLTARKYDYRITEENFKNDMLYFIRMSNLYEVGYDGWYASSG